MDNWYSVAANGESVTADNWNEMVGDIQENWGVSGLSSFNSSNALSISNTESTLALNSSQFSVDTYGNNYFLRLGPDSNDFLVKVGDDTYTSYNLSLSRDLQYFSVVADYCDLRFGPDYDGLWIGIGDFADPNNSELTFDTGLFQVDISGSYDQETFSRKYGNIQINRGASDLRSFVEIYDYDNDITQAFTVGIESEVDAESRQTCIYSCKDITDSEGDWTAFHNFLDIRESGIAILSINSGEVYDNKGLYIYKDIVLFQHKNGIYICRDILDGEEDWYEHQHIHEVNYLLDVSGTTYSKEISSQKISGGNLHSSYISLKPNRDQPTALAGTLWASSNSDGTYCPLYYCSGDTSAWKIVSFLADD